MLRRHLRGRRLARGLVVEALYRQDVVGGKASDHLEEILSREQVAPPLEAFAREILSAYARSAESVDALIARFLENWKFEEIRPLERSILRMATAELLHLDTPVPVVINEAVELVKVFCGEEPRALVNGVLDAIARERNIT